MSGTNVERMSGTPENFMLKRGFRYRKITWCPEICYRNDFSVLGAIDRIKAFALAQENVSF
jgi:hypothetical protein